MAFRLLALLAAAVTLALPSAAIAKARCAVPSKGEKLFRGGGVLVYDRNVEAEQHRIMACRIKTRVRLQLGGWNDFDSSNRFTGWRTRRHGRLLAFRWTTADHYGGETISAAVADFRTRKTSVPLTLGAANGFASDPPPTVSVFKFNARGTVLMSVWQHHNAPTTPSEGYVGVIDQDGARIVEQSPTVAVETARIEGDEAVWSSGDSERRAALNQR
jgi:hypothetical protein